jgi:hypothetical protein
MATRPTEPLKASYVAKWPSDANGSMLIDMISLPDDAAYGDTNAYIVRQSNGNAIQKESCSNAATSWVGFAKPFDLHGTAHIGSDGSATNCHTLRAVGQIVTHPRFRR